MKRFFFATLAMLFLLGCRGSDNDPAPTGPTFYANPGECDANYQHLILGDSISFARFEYSYSAHVGPVRVVAFPGWTTETFRPGTPAYLSLELDWDIPETVTILLGTNDGQVLVSEPWRVRQNLEEIITHLLADGVCRVLVMTPPVYVGFFAPRPRISALIELYANEIRSICAFQTDDLVCGPDLQEMITSDLLVDGIHPNEEGHALIAAELLEQL